ncbi:hypothetical protein Tco_0498844 [Tanacetum coccineum]
MNPVATQQIAHDNALVTPEKRLKIERCNARIEFSKPLKEETYQFSNTVKKIGKTNAHDFKLDKKKYRVDTEVFHEILQICPRLPNQDFVELPSEDDLLSFIKELGYSGNYVSLGNQLDLIGSGNHVLKSYGPCTIRRMLIILLSSGKTLCIKLTIEKSVKQEKSTSPTQDSPKKVPPKKVRKFKKHASPKLMIVLVSPKEPTQKGKRVKRPAKKVTTVPTTGVVIRDNPDKSVLKNKAPANIGRVKGIELLSNAALLKEAHMKKALKKSKRQTHKVQASGSSEGADFESEDAHEQTDNPKDTNEGTGEKPWVPDVDDVNDEDDDDDDDNGDDDNSGDNDDGGNDDGGNEDDYEENPSFTLKDYEEEEHDEEYVFTPKKDKSDDEEKMYEEEDDDVAKELYGDLNITQGLRDTDMTNAEKGREDQQNTSHESGFVLEEDDGHVTLTIVHDKTEGTMQISFVSYDFTSKLLNLDNASPDVNEIASLMNTSTFPPSPPLVNPSSRLTTTPQQQTPDSTTTTTNPTITLLEIPNFASLFRFEQRVSALETKLFEFNQTSQFAEAVSSIPGIVDQYLASKMKEAVDVAVRLQSNKLKEEAEAENQEFFNQVDSTMKAVIKE